MHVICTVGFSIFLILSPAYASTSAEQLPAEDSRTLELVDRLKELIQRAERDPRSNPWLIQRLRELVRRYDWPWRVSLLYDDFRDGNYTYNPTWVASNGDFWVARGLGLRSVVDPPAEQNRRTTARQGENPAMEMLGEILWGGKEREGYDPQPVSPALAEIYTSLRISNAFVARLQLKSYAHRNNRFEIGPYIGDDRDWGYRLVYESGERESLTLMRTAPGRSAVIEIYDEEVNLGDGNLHHIEWRRNDDGGMLVLIDDREVIRTVDRAYGSSFDGFRIINKGGNYELKQISIHGTER